uniref:Uncharacterized protein n=1 Tax=Cacopsylla melanoneura TaxID=428564 RepID=A0A8D8Q7U1_9HEMI
MPQSTEQSLLVQVLVLSPCNHEMYKYEKPYQIAHWRQTIRVSILRFYDITERKSQKPHKNSSFVKLSILTPGEKRTKIRQFSRRVPNTSLFILLFLLSLNMNCLFKFFEANVYFFPQFFMYGRINSHYLIIL